jgi:hypothetical protein
MSISLRQALRLAVGPANVDAAGHAVADWFDSIDRNATANRVREALRDQPDQPALDAVPHNRPDTSLRSELMAKLATQREVILDLCKRVDQLEMRADGLTPIERVQRRWAKEAAGPAVQSREPASVVEQPSDEELLGLDQLEAAWNAQADPANGWNELGLDEIIAWAQRQALARWGHQPAPPAEGEVGELVAALRADAECIEAGHHDLCSSTAEQLTRAAELLQQRPEPVPGTFEVTDEQRDAVRAAVANAIGDGAYDCFRVWEAWNVGTMGQDDFKPIVEDDSRIAEIADAAIDELVALKRQQRHPAPVPVSERLPELRGMFERILCVARSSGQRPVGSIELADRLISAVASWAALPLPAGEVE